MSLRVKALTVAAPDYETLEFFWTLRRLTKTNAEGQLTLEQQVSAVTAVVTAVTAVTAVRRASSRG